MEWFKKKHICNFWQRKLNALTNSYECKKTIFSAAQESRFSRKCSFHCSAIVKQMFTEKTGWKFHLSPVNYAATLRFLLPAVIFILHLSSGWYFLWRHRTEGWMTSYGNFCYGTRYGCDWLYRSVYTWILLIIQFNATLRNIFLKPLIAGVTLLSM